MNLRLRVYLLISVGLVLFLVGCGTEQLQSISIVPATVAFTSKDQTAQLKAVGTYRQGNHPATTQDVTAQVAWTSSTPSVAKVDSSGVVTSVAAGTATILASLKGGSGDITATAGVSVSIPAPRDLLSVSIIPASQSVTTLGETAQYIAIGTYSSSPTTQDLTNSVTWISSDVKVATIDSAGLATGVNDGSTTITAIGRTLAGAPITNTSQMLVSNSSGGVKLPTLALYKVGANAANGVVTSNPPGINCGTGALCTGNFPLNSTVTLTTNTPGFGGWSSNCTPSGPPAAGSSPPYTCTIVMSNNDTVGAIFN